MPWPKPPPVGVFCATPYRAAMRDVSGQVRVSILDADWTSPPGVQALTTLRGPVGDSMAPFDRFNLGLRCGDDIGIVQENRQMLQRGLDLPSPPVWLRQVHGTAVVLEPGDDEPEADAAITRIPDKVLGILTADCLPVVLASDDGDELAVAHAGWRGLAAGVLEATVTAMHAPADRVIAWLGPAAGPERYEVGSEVREVFLRHDRLADSAFLDTRPGHSRVDLYALARQRLNHVGVARVQGGGLCTISDPARFFSYRRDGQTGRMATLVWRSSPD